MVQGILILCLDSDMSELVEMVKEVKCCKWFAYGMYGHKMTNGNSSVIHVPYTYSFPNFVSDGSTVPCLMKPDILLWNYAQLQSVKNLYSDNLNK
jgi:hypothetical protein